ncbi:CRISPR-associated helicase Cas3' [Shewanella sp. NIFS-20-20]|uniref:CRISPR-associated helicase Cas3' n=1 Tax=Shewanella sp. NIFS-20-20 TaxID=2853806 RepID=UPI001C445BB7|nr:CRISPR-associated helicase Cas3' [Shewanella sp. NIFS-20-20]MBV7315797.1 CRISPR-associated helicase Cas3' [Shewanella sp. NIFS-20-20]
MRNKLPSYYQYWGKANKSFDQAGGNFHLLAYHSLDVAAVGKALIDEQRPLTFDIAIFLDIPPKQVQELVVLFLALHDLGKFASAFQKLIPSDQVNLFKPGHCDLYDGRNYRHDRMGLYFWQHIESLVFNELFSIFEVNKRDRQHAEIKKSLMVIMDCMLGHHGQPVDTKDVSAIKAFTEPTNMLAVEEFFRDVVDCLQPDLPLEKFSSKEWRKKLEQVSWQIAGLAVLADWVGSDSHFFTYQTEPIALEDYWLKAQQIAQKALAATDLNKAPIITPFQSIQAHYGYAPTPLQRWAETIEINDQPQLFILEDVTGAGKTEAALALTHRLMEAGAAEGFYFGLPTMATSNAMFARVAKHYQQMLTSEGAQPSIVLAHGAREMNDIFREAVLASGSTDTNYYQTDSTATAQCNHWLADSKKKALLAPVGVGTIDQALLAVLPRRHQSLRLLGLNRKVLIFDEVHAADEFMFELLESLLALHLHQGGSAILLTATLSLKQRQRLVNVWLNAGQFPSYPLQQQAFPLATKVALQQQSVLEQPLASRKDVSKEVAITTLNTLDACIDTILTAVAQGQCVVWVRNTVDDALAAFKNLQEQLENPEDCLLFHSRFVLADRKSIENKVLSIFGKHGDNSVRKGKVLIATQVFQESLDADADIMITDICPIDDLIQRAGRLHRHTRDHQGRHQANIHDARAQATLYIHAPEFTATPASDWLSKDFRNTQYVYRSPGRLWLGLRELLTLGAIRMPSEARQLIEAVYSDDAYNTIPATLTNQENQLIGEERSKAAKAKSQLLQWQQFGYSAESASGWYEDNSDISTRHSDIETVEVLLLKLNEAGQLAPWIDDEKFAVPLSTVKMSKHKFADKLQPIPATFANAVSQLEQQYQPIKYRQLWLPALDKNYTYHSTTGFCQVQKQEVL